MYSFRAWVRSFDSGGSIAQSRRSSRSSRCFSSRNLPHNQTPGNQAAPQRFVLVPATVRTVLALSSRHRLFPEASPPLHYHAFYLFYLKPNSRCAPTNQNDPQETTC